MENLLDQKDLLKGVKDASPDAAVCRKARATICLHVKPHHASMLRTKTTAKEVWKALEELYESQGAAAKLDLLHQLHKLELDYEESMVRYFNRVRDLRDRLVGVGHEIKEDELVLHLLNGLPEEYETEKVLITAQEKAPKLDKVFTVLLRAEQRVGVKRKHDEEAARAFVAKEHKKSQVRKCWECGQKGHLRRDCPDLKKEPGKPAFAF
jgi:hypothetical protein